MSGSLHGAGHIGRTFAIRDWSKYPSKGWDGPWDGTLTIIDFSHLLAAHKAHSRIDAKGDNTFFHEMSHVADELSTSGLWPDATQAGINGDVDETGECSASETTCGSAQATADEIQSELPKGSESAADKAFKRLNRLSDYAHAFEQAEKMLREGSCRSRGDCSK